jgi:Glucose-6-phosphate isomerase
VHLSIPAQKTFPLLPYLRGKSVAEILNAIYAGTTKSYAKHELPFLEVFLPEISERSLGAFMQWKMIETMLLGKLMDINPFDQLSVEDYKKRTRRMLSA